MFKIFVYGTLKPGEAYYQSYCEPYVIETMPALTQGYLFHLPEGYPAMTADNSSSELPHECWVTGALLQLSNEAEIAAIDEFEDYDPRLSDTENIYLRQLRPVFSMTRQPLGSAWMYMMNPERVQQRGGIPIPAGSWSQQQWPSISPRLNPKTI